MQQLAAVSKSVVTLQGTSQQLRHFSALLNACRSLWDSVHGRCQGKQRSARDQSGDFTTSRHPGCFHQLQGCSTSAISWKAGSMVLAAFRDPGVAGACRPVGAYTGTVGAHQVCSLQAMARGRSFPGAWEKGLGPRKSFNRRQTRHRLLPE